jgi:hypothetical protein
LVGYSLQRKDGDSVRHAKATSKTNSDGTLRFAKKRGEVRPAKSNRALEYFKSCPWDKWWHEFCTAREKGGSWTYTTSHAFAKDKSNRTEFCTQIIYHCIGPKPLDSSQFKTPFKQRFANIPYLGDWFQLRSRAFFYDNESVDKMRVIVASKLDGMEAGRGAATVVLDLIAKWMKYDEKVDEAFDYSPVQVGVSRTSNEIRSKIFFRMHRETLDAILELTSKYLECHGITAGGLNDLGSLIMAVSRGSANAVLQGQEQGVRSVSPALQMMMQAVMDKSKIFNIPLPPAVVGEEK